MTTTEIKKGEEFIVNYNNKEMGIEINVNDISILEIRFVNDNIEYIKYEKEENDEWQYEDGYSLHEIVLDTETNKYISYEILQ